MKGTLVVFSYVPVRVPVPCDWSRPLEEGVTLTLLTSSHSMCGEEWGKGYQSSETTVMIVTVKLLSTLYLET